MYLCIWAFNYSTQCGQHQDGYRKTSTSTPKKLWGKLYLDRPLKVPSKSNHSMILWSAMPGDTFGAVAVWHFHAHTAASAFVLASLSNKAGVASLLIRQCALWPEHLHPGLDSAGLSMPAELVRCTVFQTAPNLSSRQPEELSAEWLAALGAVGAARNKVCGHQQCQMSLHWC